MEHLWTTASGHNSFARIFFFLKNILGSCFCSYQCSLCEKMSLATFSKTFLNKAREGFFSKGAIFQSTNSLNSFTIFLKMQEFGNIFFSIVAFKYVKCDIFTTFLSNKTRIPEKKFIIVDPPFNEL